MAAGLAGLTGLVACNGKDNSIGIRGNNGRSGSDATDADQGCADSSDPGIINGRTLTPEDRISRGVVFVLSQLPDEFNKLHPMGCTGVVVSEKLILTAAHCVRTDAKLSEESRAKSTEVIFSVDPRCEVFVRKDATKRKSVEQIFFHPQYNLKGGSENDLALIFLKDAVPAYVRPMPISFEEENLKRDTQVQIAGYGRQKDLEQKDVGDLKLRYTTLFPATDPPLLIGERRLESTPGSDILILDAEQGTAACQGDSGGPAVVDRNGVLTVVGIASIVFDKDNLRRTCLSRVAYSRPSYFRKWLNDASKGAFNKFEKQSPQSLPSNPSTPPTAVPPAATGSEH